MKKILLIVICLLILTGCTKVSDMTYEDILSNITTNSGNINTYRTGYSYYLPRNMHVSDATLYNEVIEDKYNTFYLYVDVVSFHNKIEKDYTVSSSAYYSMKISYKDYYGYLEINEKNNKYLVEIMYNYAKIEVMVDKENLNEALLSAIYILKSVEYNDSVISNLLGSNILNFNEEKFNIFNTDGNDNNYIKVDENFESEETEIPDPDLIN